MGSIVLTSFAKDLGDIENKFKHIIDTKIVLLILNNGNFQFKTSQK